MTCIVGLEDNGTVFIGGDAAAVQDTTLDLMIADPKVFVLEDTMAIGFTDTFRLGQVLEHGLCLPEQSARKSDIAYLVTDFVDALRDALRERGYARKEREQNLELGGTFLFGLHGKLYEMTDYYDVIRSSVGYAAVGCGAPYALGSMYATKGQDPEKRIKTALEAAAFHNAGVRPPFSIVRVPSDSPVPGHESR